MSRRILNIVIVIVMSAAFGVVAGVAMVTQSVPVEAAPDENVSPRICMFSRDNVLQQSVVGQKGGKRLQELTQEAQQVIASDRKSLAEDIEAFNDKGDMLEGSERQSQGKALQQRQGTLKQEAQQLDARIRYTRAVVTKRINDEINPLLDESYKDHGCSILLARGAVLKGNRDNDLTADVTKALNAKVTTISFDLLALPKQSSDDGDSSSSK